MFDSTVAKIAVVLIALGAVVGVALYMVFIYALLKLAAGM